MGSYLSCSLRHFLDRIAELIVQCTQRPLINIIINGGTFQIADGDWTVHDRSRNHTRITAPPSEQELDLEGSDRRDAIYAREQQYLVNHGSHHYRHNSLEAGESIEALRVLVSNARL